MIVRKKGSAGGHNGIKNIIAQLKTEEFTRIRIGVGEKPENWDLADYVLGRFSRARQYNPCRTTLCALLNPVLYCNRRRALVRSGQRQFQQGHWQR